MTAAYDVPLARVRKRTESITRMSRLALEVGRALYPEDTREGRPATYGDCVRLGLGGEHACPYASCVHHLALDVSEVNGSITYNRPDLESDEMPETCTLAVVSRHPDGMTLEQIGAIMNLSTERARQYEERCLESLKTVVDDSKSFDAGAEKTRTHASSAAFSGRRAR